MITSDNLRSLHTKVLLNALQSWRRMCDRTYASSLDDEKYVMYVPAFYLGGEYLEPSTVTVDQLKTELATRPHVPNKQESKVIRKQKALSNKNKGRKDK